jgi:transcriptional regulator with XRE-family HTH domain
MTQQQLAEAADVADATLSRIERGRIASPSMEFAEKIARALAVPVGKLFEASSRTEPDALRACDRRLLAVVRDFEEAAVDDVTKAVKTILRVGARGAARR